MKKVYISGAITGREFCEALKHFATAENDIKLAAEKNDLPVEIVNPMTIDHSHDQSWLNFMRNDLKALVDCDSIYMLKGWHNSPGANIEYKLAKDLGFAIMFEN